MRSFSLSPTAAEALQPAEEILESAPAKRCVGRIRLLLLTDTSILSMGGSERFLRNLVSRLPTDRYDVTVVQLTRSTRAWSDTSLPPGLQEATMRVLDTGAIYGPRGWQALRELRRMLLDERFDIVQSHHEKSDVLNALLPRIDGTIHLSNRRDMGFNKSPRLRLLFRFLNHRFHGIIAPARPILRDLEAGERVDPRQTVWIPNGVDTLRFRPGTPAGRTASRATLGIRDDAVVFGCVASLTPVKRHADVLAAFATARAALPASRLLLVGDGPLRAGLVQQAEALGLGDAVMFAGNLQDVEHTLPAMDVVLLASSSEGMSNALLEAMACGLPIIATAVGGNLQLVRDGHNGMLVPALRPDALAAAMVALGADPALRARMGRSSRERIEGEFSIDSMVRAFDRLYHRLLGRP